VNRAAESRPADKVVASGAARAGHGRGADPGGSDRDRPRSAPGVTHHDITAATAAKLHTAA
jgi:hypothetical protein